MAELRWTREAESALRDIHDAIALDRPETASRTIDSIVNRVESLAGAEERGTPHPLHRRWRVHLLPYGSFRIAYRVEPTEDVTVLAVFNGLMFLPRK